MNDDFLHEYRRDPDPTFTRSLRERLHAQPAPHARHGTLAASAWVALVVLVGAGALVFFPSVRASAQSMLDLFRVRKFAAVRFDESRTQRLRALEQGHALLVFDRQETVREPGPAQVVPSLDAAAALAGGPLASPTYVPAGLHADTIRVEGEGEARFSVSEAKLRTLLESLDLRDVAVPAGLDGKLVEVRKPPVVVQQFRSPGGNVRVTLVQAKSPEVRIPAGLDLPGLAEIGLRVLGLDRSEAHRLATTTDWRTTLVVPVPMNASTFREVTVHGASGLMITSTGKNAEGERRSEGTIVLWSENDRVYAVLGKLSDRELLQMAESVR